jgi:hypothetical protein
VSNNASSRVSFFGAQSIRLIKEKWKTPMQLAEELYTMITSGDPVNIPAGSTIAPPAPGQPYLNLPGYTQGDSIMNLTRDGRPVGDITVFGDQIQFVGPGQSPGGSQQQQGGKGQGSPAFPGVIKSGGPGNSYIATIFEGGVTSTSGKDVNVTQLQIDPSATLPPGLPVTVFLGADGKYWINSPIWG